VWIYVSPEELFHEHFVGQVDRCSSRFTECVCVVALNEITSNQIFDELIQLDPMQILYLLCANMHMRAYICMYVLCNIVIISACIMLISAAGYAEFCAAVGGAWCQRYGQLHRDVRV